MMGIRDEPLETMANGLVAGFAGVFKLASLFIPKEFCPGIAPYASDEVTPATSRNSDEFRTAVRRAQSSPEPHELTRDEVNLSWLMGQKWDWQMDPKGSAKDTKGRILYVLHPNNEDAINTPRIHEVMDDIIAGNNAAVSGRGVEPYSPAKNVGLGQIYSGKYIYVVPKDCPLGRIIDAVQNPRIDTPKRRRPQPSLEA